MTNIVFIGLRGSGKTQIAKRLAKTMKRQFIDTDLEIQKQTHCSIAKLIAKKGWNFFRKKEKYIVRRVSKLKSVIIATGGGAVLDTENAKHLKKNGFLVYLQLPTAQLATRLQDDTTRPSLTDAPDLISEIEQLRAKREPTYLALADLVFQPQADSPDSKKDIKTNTANLNLTLQTLHADFKKPRHD